MSIPTGVRQRPSVRQSSFLIPTERDTPADAEMISHQLMIRAGMIRQSASGIYIWLPLGYRALSCVADVIRDEQIRAGAAEMQMPTIQQADLWKTSGRYDSYGKELLRFPDRSGREMLYGPTNEEQITDLFSRTITSYRDLPLNLFHIQLKFRDEIRPRSGVMRGREFLMKDGYSFDFNAQNCAIAYRRVFVSYLSTLARFNLRCVPLAAQTGPIGGSLSHEFAVLSDHGDTAVRCDRALLNLPMPIIANYADADIEGIYKTWTSYPATADDETLLSGSDPDLITTRGIEVAHVFSFADKYSRPLGAYVEDPNGQRVAVHMGSYGIGVSRLLAALIEVGHDDHGIVWNPSIAPFDLSLLCLQPQRLPVLQAAEQLFAQLDRAGLSVLYDDRSVRPGVKFSDADLIGLPWRVVVSERGLSQGQIDVRNRQTGQTTDLTIESLVNFLNNPPPS